VGGGAQCVRGNLGGFFRGAFVWRVAFRSVRQSMEMKMASARAQTMDIQNVVVEDVFWCLVFGVGFFWGRGGLGWVGWLCRLKK
jgi:hypothetical protein